MSTLGPAPAGATKDYFNPPMTIIYASWLGN